MKNIDLRTPFLIVCFILGLIATHWLSYYFENRPTAPTEPQDQPTKEWPAEPNHDKG